jgi:hypothetical protein
MKSVERHKLETNVLAHGLEVYIERYKPYVAKIAAGALAFVAILFIWSYVSGSSSAQKNSAWDAYNDAVGSQPMNLEQLRRAAEENPGTKMQQMADVTWADGQVMMASNSYIYNRAAANKYLGDAAGRYQGVLQTTDDPRLIGRARLGLARISEMQGDLDKAREQYEQVTGAYAKYAKDQIERLAKPDAKETYAWLQTAQPPKPVAPLGPGVPGQRPEFSPGEIALPTGAQTSTGEPTDQKSASEAFDQLLKEMQKESKDGEKADDRYKTEQPPAEGKANGDAATSAPPAAAPADEKSSK